MKHAYVPGDLIVLDDDKSVTIWDKETAFNPNEYVPFEKTSKSMLGPKIGIIIGVVRNRFSKEPSGTLLTILWRDIGILQHTTRRMPAPFR